MITAGTNVRCQRSVSAEALRDVKVNMRVKPDLTLPKSTTLVAMGSIDPVHLHTTQAEVHKDLSPDSSTVGVTDSRLTNDPFADDADHILSKHQSLIVGSMEDLFAAAGSNVRDFVIQEEGSGNNSTVSTQEKGRVGLPTPPPRSRSRCLSDSSFVVDSQAYHYTDVASAPDEQEGDGPPPLPPKQYKGSRRKFKPLPAEPQEDYAEDSSDKNTDSESIKQEMNALTSQIASLTSRSAYHN